MGQLGEEEAARFLEKRKLTVVDRNVRSALGEIDLVARDGATLVFVEVKTRRASRAGIHAEGAGGPEAGVTPAKQRRLARLARHYLKQRRLGDIRCRFDVVAVTLDDADRVTAVRHLPGAFEGGAW